MTELRDRLVRESSLYIEPPLELVDSNPNNTRRTYVRLRELADSIDRLGLIQNLVVLEQNGRFVVKAGERRLRAIRLLNKEGKWKGGVPCLVATPESAELVNLAENASRVDVPVWHEGHRFLELIEAGMRQSDLAAAIGKSQQYVSYASSLAASLAPETIDRLDRIDTHFATARLLRTLSRLRLPSGEPDRLRQVAMLDAFHRSRDKKQPKSRHRDRRLKGRIELLSALGDTLGLYERRIVRACIRFLESEEQSLNL